MNCRPLDWNYKDIERDACMIKKKSMWEERQEGYKAKNIHDNRKVDKMQKRLTNKKKKHKELNKLVGSNIRRDNRCLTRRVRESEDAYGPWRG
jgi:hypothetical protein